TWRSSPTVCNHSDKFTQDATKVYFASVTRNPHQHCKYCQRFPNPGLWQELTDSVREAVAGCSGCYVGEVVIDEEGAKLIRYIANSGTAPGEARLQGSEGVVWQVLQPRGEEEEEGDQEPSPRSRQLYISNVMDVPEVKYFEFTKPGSFLAIPITYSSLLNKEGLEAAVTDMKERRAQFAEEMASFEEAKAQYEQAVAELKEGEENPEEPVQPVIRELSALEGVTGQLVLCVDTLGAEGGLLEIRQQYIEELAALCGHLEKGKAAMELQAVREQAEYITSEAGEANRTELMGKYVEATGREALEEVEKRVEEEIEGLGEGSMRAVGGRGSVSTVDTTDDDKEVIRLAHKLKMLRSVLDATLKGNLLLDISSRKLPEEALAVLMKAVLFFLAEQDASSIYGDMELQWSQLVAALHSDGIWEKIISADMRRPRPGVPSEHTLERAKALVEEAIQCGGQKAEDGAIEEEVSKERPAEVILLGLLEAAVELREKDVRMRWLNSDLHKRIWEPRVAATEEVEKDEGDTVEEGKGEEAGDSPEGGGETEGALPAKELVEAPVAVDPSEASAIDADFVPLLEAELAQLAEEREASAAAADGGTE
ncbi:hypothetical protein Pmar_PMAR007245, partial [Perkinsus marinus ATCC 50983]